MSTEQKKPGTALVLAKPQDNGNGAEPKPKPQEPKPEVPIIRYQVEGETPFGSIRIEIVAPSAQAAGLVLIASATKFLQDLQRDVEREQANAPKDEEPQDADFSPVPGASSPFKC
jgi:hypothetical protein